MARLMTGAMAMRETKIARDAAVHWTTGRVLAKNETNAPPPLAVAALSGFWIDWTICDGFTMPPRSFSRRSGVFQARAFPLSMSSMSLCRVWATVPDAQ